MGCLTNGSPRGVSVWLLGALAINGSVLYCSFLANDFPSRATVLDLRKHVSKKIIVATTLYDAHMDILDIFKQVKYSLWIL